MLLACITPACNIACGHLYDPILGYCRQWIDVHWLRNIIGIAQLPKSLKMAHLFKGSVQQINTWFHYVKFIIPTMHCLVGRYFIQKVHIHIYLSYHKGLYSIYKVLYTFSGVTYTQDYYLWWVCPVSGYQKRYMTLTLYILAVISNLINDMWVNKMSELGFHLIKSQ